MISRSFTYEKRRGRESNPRIAVLQTATLPLGYPANMRARTIWLERRLYQAPSADSKRSSCEPLASPALTIQRIRLSSGVTKSSKLFVRAQKFIPGGVNSPVRAFRNVGGDPFFAARAQGARIWDVDGTEYIDYVGSWGPAILGHAPKVVVDAVRQAATGGLTFGIPNPAEVEIAELICDWMPSIEKVRMVNSGTEATMSSIRLARAFT